MLTEEKFRLCSTWFLESAAASLHRAFPPFSVAPFQQPSALPASPAVAELLSRVETGSKTNQKKMPEIIRMIKKNCTHSVYIM